MVSLGFKSGYAGLEVQMNPLLAFFKNLLWIQFTFYPELYEALSSFDFLDLHCGAWNVELLHNCKDR